ncbi:salicylate hydroxylase [Colletotrichum plurivorum]|uniref:Salicylate hydroxylase n=1 Tax=Colletotrichum plurivorum TaxID=2175906 RepID=A0A8H6K281_9PEZI|nr:salicylate hydroxylase [Colletotrichum plurivorum]
MKVIIVGAGLGGLACAIACRREGLDVVVLERASRIVPIGSGIHVPPNAARVARQLGYLDKLHRRGGVGVERIEMRRYADGRPLHALPAGHGDLPWLVVHRAEYHGVLWETCAELGVGLCLDMEVERIDFETNTVYLEDGDDISGDVIIGADGLYSVCRDQLLGSPSPAVETSDLAYRVTLPLDYLKTLGDPRIDEFCARKQVTVWLGPSRHATFCPVRGGRELNLTLLKQDDAEGHGDGDVGKMKQAFEGWDETLSKLISRVPRVQKWKPCTHPELETWTKGQLALLGDSCHPSPAYQSQGAAMAVEDGAVLGKLLGLLERSPKSGSPESISQVLRLYEYLRKSRTAVNMAGAASNKKWYHVADGPDQEARDAEMAGATPSTGWRWMDPEYREQLLGHDAVAEAVETFGRWEKEEVMFNSNDFVYYFGLPTGSQRQL